MKYLVSIVVAVAIAWAIGFFFFVAPIFGWHVVISEGEHNGIITAVEKNGLFFKTDTAYVKTDSASSQEDIYCVVNPEVSKALKEASITRQKVTVTYVSWLFPGIIYCNGEEAVITAVTPS